MLHEYSLRCEGLSVVSASSCKGLPMPAGIVPTAFCLSSWPFGSFQVSACLLRHHLFVPTRYQNVNARHAPGHTRQHHILALAALNLCMVMSHFDWTLPMLFPRSSFF